jgi:thymidylate synthase
MDSFDDFDAAYRHTLRVLRSEGVEVPGTKDETSIGSAFGTRPRPTKELVGYTFCLASPQKNHVRSSARNVDYGYACANLVWFLSGSRSVDDIAFYNNRGRLFSDDGRHFAGALGHRVIHTAEGDQLDAAIRTLQQDPTSRRALVVIYRAEDSIRRPRDTPCSIALHFLMRNNSLVAISNMRSQSAAMVMPYDVHLFTSLQAIVAHRVGVALGSYIHTANSLHYYLDEENVVSAVLDEPLAPQANQEPVLTSHDVDSIPQVIIEERQMRAHLQQGGVEDFRVSPDLGDFWTRGLLLAQSSWRAKQRVAKE